MTRVSGNDYNDAFDNEQWRHRNRENLSKQRLTDPNAMAGGVLDTVPPQAPNFVHDYYDYYKTPRGYHKHSGNSNDGWRVIGTQAYANSRFLYYCFSESMKLVCKDYYMVKLQRNPQSGGSSAI